MKCGADAASCKVALDRSPMFAPGRRWESEAKSALKRFNQNRFIPLEEGPSFVSLIGKLLIRVRDLVASLISCVGPKKTRRAAFTTASTSPSSPKRNRFLN